MRMRLSFCFATGLLVATSGIAQAGLITIDQPGAGYVSGTTLIPITVANFTDVSSLSDVNLTIAFSDPMNARTVPTGGWATWGAPPETEGNTPRVLTSLNEANPTTRTLTFSSALSTFGLEAEPQLFAVFDITLDFFNGNDLVGSITRSPDGSAGALLFAATATGGDVFTKVVLTTTDTTGFGTAQYRYAQAAAVPEPSILAMGATATLLGLGWTRRRRHSASR